ncbi:MAG TPA: hypothetical protein VFA88_01065, partial [Gaiellaceae bacterium]|nr:hypothetical protein [Gaiellaceae bacterium]
SVVNIAGTAALLVLLRKRIDRIEGNDMASVFARVTVASVLAGGLGFGVWKGLDSAVGRSLGGQLVSLPPALVVAGAVYLTACRALQVREMQALLSLRSRLRRV